jgi:hypothetical protein
LVILVSLKKNNKEENNLSKRAMSKKTIAGKLSLK